jgi:hypothetical protein
MKIITKITLISTLILFIITSFPTFACAEKGIEFKYKFKDGDVFKLFENKYLIVTFSGNDNTNEEKTIKEIKISKNNSNSLKIKETILESNSDNLTNSKKIGKVSTIKFDSHGNNSKTNKPNKPFLISFPTKKISPGYSWTIKHKTKDIKNIGTLNMVTSWHFDEVKKNSTTKLAYFSGILKTFNNSRTSLGTGTIKIIFDINKGYCTKGKFKSTTETNGDFGNGKVSNSVRLDNSWELIPQVIEKYEEW